MFDRMSNDEVKQYEERTIPLDQAYPELERMDPREAEIKRFSIDPFNEPIVVVAPLETKVKTEKLVVPVDAVKLVAVKSYTPKLTSATAPEYGTNPACT